MKREQFHWQVDLQSESGQVGPYPLSTYWSPDREGAEGAVMVAAAAEATVKSGGKKHFPLAARRIATPAAA